MKYSGRRNPVLKYKNVGDPAYLSYSYVLLKPTDTKRAQPNRNNKGIAKRQLSIRRDYAQEWT
jgi:hypothetical protein